MTSDTLGKPRQCGRSADAAVVSAEVRWVLFRLGHWIVRGEVFSARSASSRAVSGERDLDDADSDGALGGMLGVYADTLLVVAHPALGVEWKAHRQGERRMWIAMDTTGRPAVQHGLVCVRYSNDAFARTFTVAASDVLKEPGLWGFVRNLLGGPREPLPAPRPGPDAAELVRVLADQDLLRPPFRIEASPDGPPTPSFSAKTRWTGDHFDEFHAELRRLLSNSARVVALGTPAHTRFGAEDGFELGIHASRVPVPLNLQSPYGKKRSKRVRVKDADVVFHRDSETGGLGAHLLYCSMYGKHAPMPEDLHDSEAARVIRVGLGAPLIIGTQWS